MDYRLAYYAARRQGEANNLTRLPPLRYAGAARRE